MNTNGLDIMSETEQLMNSIGSKKRLLDDEVEVEEKPARKGPTPIKERIAALEYVEKHGLPKACKDLSIVASQYYRWRNEFNEGMYNNLDPDRCYIRMNTKEKLTDTIRRLEDENTALKARLQQVNEFLKAFLPRK